MTMHAHPHSDNTKQTKRTTHRNSENEGSKKIVLFEIALEMNKANLPKMFIVDAIRAALDFEGISNLMKLWRDEKEPEEKNEMIYLNEIYFYHFKLFIETNKGSIHPQSDFLYIIPERAPLPKYFNRINRNYHIPLNNKQTTDSTGYAQYSLKNISINEPYSIFFY